MQSKATKLKESISQPGSIRLEIKICGLTNVEDALAAWEFGADWLGFILHPPSPRYITPADLRQLRARLPAEARCVGVFVNASAADVRHVMNDCGLTIAQMHGDENFEEFARMTDHVWRALRLSANGAIPNPANWQAARYVLDADVPGLYGGSGQCADWQQAATLARQYPVMLAGGLTPDNVGAAIQTVRPLGVDVAGGVEKTPGKKDIRKLHAFITAARQAEKHRN